VIQPYPVVRTGPAALGVVITHRWPAERPHPVRDHVFRSTFDVTVGRRPRAVVTPACGVTGDSSSFPLGAEDLARAIATGAEVPELSEQSITRRG
jgi:hypothetical protein